MKLFEIWDHWTKLGEVEAYNPDHAIRKFKRENGLVWVKMFACACE